MNLGVFTFFAWFALTNSAAGAAQEKIDLEVQPSTGELGFFFSGVEVRITANVDPDTEVAIVMIGPPVTLHMRRNERVFGMFWAPMGRITFEAIPSLYFLRTSADLVALAPKEILDELGVGYESLISPKADAETKGLLPDLIRLKESEGLFSSATAGTMIASELRGNRKQITAAFSLPSNAPATSYAVRLYGFRDGSLAAQGRGEFDLNTTKLVALTTSLAWEHGLMYGLLAVVVALGAGLGVGFLYGSRK